MSWDEVKRCKRSAQMEGSGESPMLRSERRGLSQSVSQSVNNNNNDHDDDNKDMSGKRNRFRAGKGMAFKMCK